jgi:hypothetical protein
LGWLSSVCRQEINPGKVGSNVDLIWAPDAPGWPRQGANWYEAQQVCQYLGQDGLTVAPVPQHIWRLPTVDEAIRSMARHEQNSGGVSDAETAKATYETTPDKESPLWNVHSQVIYWWTVTEADEDTPTSLSMMEKCGQEQSSSVRHTWSFDV